MRIVKFTGALILAVFLSSCGYERALMDWAVPDDIDARGRHQFEELRAGRIAPLEARLSGQLRTPQAGAAMQQMAGLFPKETPRSVKVVGYHSSTANGFTRYGLSYEYEFEKSWLIGTVILRSDNEQIEGMTVLPIAQSIETANGFTFSGKSWRHYGFLAATVAMALFTLFTVYMCFRTPIPKRRWLWVIIALVGIMPLEFNWTTGNMLWKPFGIILFSASFLKHLYAPVLLQIGIPLGAIIFWIRRRSWLKRAAEPQAPAIAETGKPSGGLPDS